MYPVDRFLIEELFSWRNEASRYLGTAMALALPCLLVFQQFPWSGWYSATRMESHLAPIWSNQSITRSPCFAYLCGLLKASKVGYGFALLPAVVMIVMPMTALALMVEKFGISTLLGGTAAAMFLLGMFLMVTSWRRLTRSDGERLQPEAG